MGSGVSVFKKYAASEVAKSTVNEVLCLIIAPHLLFQFVEKTPKKQKLQLLDSSGSIVSWFTSVLLVQKFSTA